MKQLTFAAAAAAMGLAFASTAGAAIVFAPGDGSYTLDLTATQAASVVDFGMWNPPSFTYITDISLVDTSVGGANLLNQNWANLGGPLYCCSGSYDDGSQAGGLTSGSFAPYTVFEQDVTLTPGDSYELSFNVSNSYGYTQYGSVSGAAVPEPAAWIVMLAGFGLAGATIRGRRKAISA